MELHVNHKDFIKNRISILFSAFKIQVLYNGTPAKAKRGKYHLEDDNKKIREVKVVDYLVTSPYVTVDKTEKISVFPKVPRYMFILFVPSILMIRFGIIGWAVAALSVYSIRNICISEERTTLNKCLMSIMVIVASYVILIALLFGILALIS